MRSLALSFRLYQLFRVFWLQNLLAMAVGGMICLLLFLVFQITLVSLECIQQTRDSFFVQVIPDLSLQGLGREKSVPTPPVGQEVPKGPRSQDVIQGGGAFEDHSQLLGRIKDEILAQFPNAHIEIHQDGEVFSKLLASLESDVGAPSLRQTLLAGFPSYLNIRLTDAAPDGWKRLEEVATRVKGVSSVQADRNLIEFLSSSRAWIAWILGTLSVFLGGCLFYILQFVLSQLVLARKQEIQLEYMLGATKSYQKAPYWIFACLFVSVSLIFAALAYGVWILPLWPGWLAGLEYMGFTLKMEGMAIPLIQGSVGFVLAFLGGVLFLFHLSWEKQIHKALGEIS
jgi:hypothetical protein